MPRYSAVCAIVMMMTVAAGCASATTTASGAGGAPASGASASAAPPGCAAKTVTITLASNGKALCVTTGTAVTVSLRSTSGSKWQQITSDSTVLVPRSGSPGLPATTTEKAFTAARPGKAIVSSLRFACQHGPVALAAKATARPCGAIVAFHATITVARS